MPAVAGAVTEFVQPYDVPSVGGCGGSSRSDDYEMDKKSIIAVW